MKYLGFVKKQNIDFQEIKKVVRICRTFQTIEKLNKLMPEEKLRTLEYERRQSGI